jgi:hypothetical protein
MIMDKQVSKKAMQDGKSTIRERDDLSVELQANEDLPVSDGQLMKGHLTASESAVTGRSGEERRQMLIGANAHLIVATVLRQGPKSGPLARALQLTEVGRNVFVRQPVGYRSREAMTEAVTASGVYFARFALTNPWVFVQAEYAFGNCRFDVVWENDGHFLIDELKLGRGRNGQVMLAEQISRYDKAGRSHWGDTFLGIRMCAVSEPRRSRFYKAGSSRSIELSQLDALK